jgi:1-acyl-sn-glycerol-3-phosphate acyltransferase
MTGLNRSGPTANQNRSSPAKLPKLTRWRLFVRRLTQSAGKLIVMLAMKTSVCGLENFPREGRGIIVTNHLGDADSIMALAFFPRDVETMAKSELIHFPFLGKLMEAFGVIWVNRWQPDRQALRAALQALVEGRLVAIAPEGRESMTGGLEEGTGGAAFLALQANAPVVPVTFTGTENKSFYGNLRRLRRTHTTMTVGKAFYLSSGKDRKSAVDQGTNAIMLALAKQLPAEYRGVYRDGVQE